MIATLHRIAAALRRWQYKQQIRRKIAEGHEERAQKRFARCMDRQLELEREREELRIVAVDALALAEKAFGELPPMRRPMYVRRLAQLQERIETK